MKTLPPFSKLKLPPPPRQKVDVVRQLTLGTIIFIMIFVLFGLFTGILALIFG